MFASNFNDNSGAIKISPNEVVNFTFSKQIAADSVKSLEAIDPQYTRVGAVYTLYKDANATQPVTRDGQVYVDDATGEFYGTAGAGRTLALNAKFERANSVGEITLVNITRARQFEAA